MGFTCTVCGRFHEDEALDIRMRRPEPVARLSESERDERVTATDDFCSLDDAVGRRFFVRGLLEIAIHGEDSYFGYGSWVEVDEGSFRRLHELWSDPDGADQPPFEGVLANELTPYRGTEGLPVELRLREVRLLPTIHPADVDHPLADDWAQGIDMDDARHLAEGALHPG